MAIFDLAHVVTQVGSTNFNDERMVFGQETLSFDQEQSNTILDYQVIRDGGEQDLSLKKAHFHHYCSVLDLIVFSCS